MTGILTSDRKGDDPNTHKYTGETQRKRPYEEDRDWTVATSQDKGYQRLPAATGN